VTGDILSVVLLVRQVEGTVEQRLQLLRPTVVGDTNDRYLQLYVSPGFSEIWLGEDKHGSF
jgi:hypothetical protein